MSSRLKSDSNFPHPLLLWGAICHFVTETERSFTPNEETKQNELFKNGVAMSKALHMFNQLSYTHTLEPYIVWLDFKKQENCHYLAFVLNDENTKQLTQCCSFYPCSCDGENYRPGCLLSEKYLIIEYDSKNQFFVIDATLHYVENPEEGPNYYEDTPENWVIHGKKLLVPKDFWKLYPRTMIEIASIVPGATELFYNAINGQKKKKKKKTLDNFFIYI